MVKIKRSGDFDAMLEDLCEKDEILRDLFKQTIVWFKRNPDDTRINNHPLTKRMEGKWSFSITEDIRIIYEWTSKTSVRFLIIGSHDTVYNKN